ncbi:MAG: hypothetical protein AB7U34_07460 [Novosphingobium sp.]
MQNETIDDSETTNQRADIERIIARYPDIHQHEQESVLHYLRREASSFDQAMIASNEAIHTQFKQFQKDHRLDRLGPWEITAVIIAAIVIFGLLLFAIISVEAGA